MAKLARSLEDTLVKAALDARTRAYAPYSRFAVGACVLVANDDGAITMIEGANVENASYGLCICAERTAIAAAVSLGWKRVLAVAVATGSSPPSPPCGMCRQVIAEFALDAVVVCANDKGERVRTSSKRLLPGSFNADLLERGRGPATRARAKKRGAKSSAR